MAMPLDPKALSLVIHDLRNPLNVIGLSLRMIEEELPAGHDDLAEDVLILRENVGQLDRMLRFLSDFCRQQDGASRSDPMPFEPARLLEEVVEDLAMRQPDSAGRVHLEGLDEAPAEVVLDPTRARLALSYALTNALAGSVNGHPIRIRAGGAPDRWVTRVTVEAPPPETVQSTPLAPDDFERLIAIPAERRGLELTIAARISQIFGGEARLEVEPGRRSTVVLDWPARIDQGP